MLEFIPRPWHLLVLFLGSQLNREQQRIIEYLQVENQVLREKLGKGRVLLNDDQRRILAVKGKALGRRLLRELASIVASDKILRWHRELVAQKWDFGACASGHALVTGIPCFLNGNGVAFESFHFVPRYGMWLHETTFVGQSRP